MASKKTLEQFIEQSKIIHGDKYDYSNTVYRNNHSLIEIICPDHGPFSVYARNHSLKKTGCPKCGIVAMNYKSHAIKGRKTHEQFLMDAFLVHGNKFDYSLCNYIGGKVKMPIICRTHGIFYQHAENHINSKRGCRKCYNESMRGKTGKSGYCATYFESYPEKKNNPALIYIARMQHKNDDFIKIGITTKESVKARYWSKTKNGTIITPLLEQFETLYDAYLKEKELISILSLYRYFPNRKFGGYTECFKNSKDVFNLLESFFGINIQKETL